MIASFRFGFLIVGVALYSVRGTAQAREDQKNGSRARRREVSFEEYRALRGSTGADKFYYDQESSTSFEDAWYEAIDFEWARAHESEKAALRKLTANKEGKRRRQLNHRDGGKKGTREVETPTTLEESEEDDITSLEEDIITTLEEGGTVTPNDDGTYPFFVCVQREDILGAEAYETVTSRFNTENIIPVSSVAGSICYWVTAGVSTASLVTTQDDTVMVMPLLAEAKIAAQTEDYILNGEDSPRGIDGQCCKPAGGGERNQEETERFLNDLLDSIDEDPLRKRSLRTTKDTLHMNNTPQVESFKRRLAFATDCTEISTTCAAYVQKLTATASLDGQSFDVSYPLDEPDSDGKRECLACVSYLVASHPAVCSVEAIVAVRPQNIDSVWVGQSNVEGETPFFDKGIDGTGQIVQVSDSGLDIDHCSFRPSNLVNPAVAVTASRAVSYPTQKVVQYVWNRDSGDGSDHTGHGTHVVGSAVGGNDNSANGMAPGGKVAFYDIGSPGAFAPPTNIENALLLYGYSAGAKFHSASWGGAAYGVLTGSTARFDNFAYWNDDFLFLAAAGNSGESKPDPPSVLFPATTKNGIGVGAGNDAPFQQYVATFSSEGTTLDGRIKPDVVAVGVRVLSASEGTSCSSRSLQGTSMATPIASGAAMLVRQYFVDGFYPGGVRGSSNEHSNPSGALIKAVLLGGAQEMDFAKRGSERSIYYDRYQGFGRIDLIKSLPLQGENNFQSRIFDRVPITQGQSNTVTVTINNSGACDYNEFRAQLVWYDYYNAGGCSKNCLFNDLDLLVVSGETRSYPNGRNRKDDVNTAERVIIKDPPDGRTFNITVTGASFSAPVGGPQKYSLVLLGCLADDDPGPGTADLTVQSFLAHNDPIFVVPDFFDAREKDWVGIFSLNAVGPTGTASRDDALMWVNSCGTQECTNPVVEGEAVVFNGPNTEGKATFPLDTATYELIAARDDGTVLNTYEFRVRVNPTQITVASNNPSADPVFIIYDTDESVADENDWLGIFPRDESNISQGTATDFTNLNVCGDDGDDICLDYVYAPVLDVGLYKVVLVRDRDNGDPVVWASSDFQVS
mmetsp:Transcript_21070/g.31264  ORF Transcript_21070/g.31264 Transcript_21070/m.31264 type:complete len:1078 (-) Transcript_21070:290-3523(-)